MLTIGATALVLSAVCWTTSAGAADGQLTRIGGNSAGCPTDAEILEDLRKPEAERLKRTYITPGFSKSQGIQAIASDLSSADPYVLSAGQIFQGTKIIAESLTVGDDTASAGRYYTTGMAVHPLGGSLWVVQAYRGDGAPGRVRHVDLTTHEVTTVAQTGREPTAVGADGKGNLYVTEHTGDVYMVGSGGMALQPVSGPTGIAVDVMGTEIYVAGAEGVYRLAGSSKQLVAGRTVTHADGTSAVTNPRAVALGHETDGKTVGARYLYIADNGRVVRADLQTQPPTITTVAGGGSTFVSTTTSDARTAKLEPLGLSLAANMAGQVFIADSEQCAVFALQTPPAFRLNTVVTNPPAVTNTTAPTGGSRTGDADKTAPDQAGATNGGTQTETGAAGQQSANTGARTEIVPGSQTNVQPQAQTELRIIDPGNVLTTPEQAARPTVDAVPTPSPTAQFTPSPTPSPSPTPAPDAGAGALADPGTSTAGVSADTAPAVPPAPAAAPPAPASAPPPAAPQPVSNVGLAHGDSAAPSRGATRYAMVRNDDEQSIAGLAMAGAGAVVAIFLCVMFVAPGASSKPRPRPKGAY
ncbi:MAG TPA: hypothetical protein VM388_03910 [Acidimicrobiales bacterium]|nr:hypothetical protein [Acidimicrobiales bacterium]